jgi:transposase
VISLDNGPKNSGRRTQFLKRMVPFADWSGLEIRLVSDPHYHSKSNPIERCWSALEKKWNGVLGVRQDLYSNRPVVEVLQRSGN